MARELRDRFRTPPDSLQRAAGEQMQASLQGMVRHPDFPTLATRIRENVRAGDHRIVRVPGHRDVILGLHHNPNWRRERAQMQLYARHRMNGPWYPVQHLPLLLRRQALLGARMAGYARPAFQPRFGVAMSRLYAPSNPQRWSLALDPRRSGGAAVSGRRFNDPRRRAASSRAERTPSRRQAKETEPELWKENVSRETGATVAQKLGQLTVLGQNIAAPSVTASFPKKHDIPPSRIPQHVENLGVMGKRLEDAATQRGWKKENVTAGSNGLQLWLKSGSETLLATRTLILSAANATPEKPGGTWTTEDGAIVTWERKANRDVFSLNRGNSRTRISELHDGRMLREQMSGRGDPDVTSFYDRDAKRPDLIRVNAASATVPLAADGTGETVQLRHGMHIVGENGVVPLARPGSPEQADDYLREVAKTLRSPEAIGAFVSSFFTGHDSIALKSRKGYRIPTASTVLFENEKRGEQYIKSPAETISDGKGDCEDFAVLAWRLCKEAGIPALIARQSHNHYVCTFLEPAPGGFIRSQIDTGGFSRNRDVFSTAAAAMASTWDDSDPSAVHWELKDTSDMTPDAIAQAQEVQRSGGGLSILLGETVHDGKAQGTYLPLRGHDWEQYVRK